MHSEKSTGVSVSVSNRDLLESECSSVRIREQELTIEDSYSRWKKWYQTSLMMTSIMTLTDLVSCQWPSTWMETSTSVEGVSGQSSKLDASPSTGVAAMPQQRAPNTVWTGWNTRWRSGWCYLSFSLLLLMFEGMWRCVKECEWVERCVNGCEGV